LEFYHFKFVICLVVSNFIVPFSSRLYIFSFFFDFFQTKINIQRKNYKIIPFFFNISIYFIQSSLVFSIIRFFDSVSFFGCFRNDGFKSNLNSFFFLRVFVSKLTFLLIVIWLFGSILIIVSSLLTIFSRCFFALLNVNFSFSFTLTFFLIMSLLTFFSGFGFFNLLFWLSLSFTHFRKNYFCNEIFFEKIFIIFYCYFSNKIKSYNNIFFFSVFSLCF